MTGTILHFNGTTWSSVPTTISRNPRERMGNVAVRRLGSGRQIQNSPNEQFGIIIHFDGTRWSEVGRDPAVGETRTACWGTSLSDVGRQTFRGHSGTRDGTNWSTVLISSFEWVESACDDNWGSRRR